jgi:5-methyltetrahydrofolate--homocysteine methyltransferase
MVHVAKEMERQGWELPLLIGGATTSRQHTAVKIAPGYHGSTVHVPDASRVVDVVSQLLDPRRRADLDGKNRQEQARLREIYGGPKSRPLVPLSDARRKPTAVQWHADDVTRPDFLGVRQVELPIAEIVPYIDWTFFFSAWQLKGRYPQILEHEKYGEAAREIFDHGRAMLDRLITEGRLRARGVIGFWPAEAQGDDIVLFDDAERRQERLRFNMLRQQSTRAAKEEYMCLADFVAPQGSGISDHLGAFAVTAGLGAAEIAREFEAQYDDYNAIMVKALADRLAEAFAELMHERARRAWGHAERSQLSNDDLIAQKYRGIRPAFGYPACPDHSEKRKLFELLGAEDVGIHLTENFAMTPPASVSGIYLGHSDARYFTVGRIGRDQVEDYAKRKGMPVAEVEKWLGPNLGYEPDSSAAA